MDNKEALKALEPKEVFNYFYEISNIPRGSGNEKQISDYLMKFAEKHNLEARQDKALNVVIKKDGTKGYKHLPAVILQGHMDMVCEKNESYIHDFLRDPIKLKLEGEYLTAEGTTLGADNGIAVAYCLAILAAKDIPHPPLEVIITSEEEIGLKGAAKLKTFDIEGKYLINIDAEDEGVFFSSCAGGARTIIDLPIHWEIEPEEYDKYSLMITGLKGGHSGGEINKNRGNSNKLIGRILNQLKKTCDIKLAYISGGLKENAIPREAKAKLLVNKKNNILFKKQIDQISTAIKNELALSDPNFNIDVEISNDSEKRMFSDETTDNVISILMNIPYGVQTMSMDIEGLVESSTNIGVVQVDKDSIKFKSATRSSVGSLKQYILEQIETLAKSNNAKFELVSSYPEWKYNRHSKLRELFIKVYKEEYNKKPEIAAIHAGLECGLLSEKLENVDMIAIGPNMHDVHTPDERLNIKSTKRTWEFILQILKEIKQI
ncbi:aminoacyl-histidine dipeptidase [Abyssisolibacter fermentans]|uniref:aminoacyl-histidine dipeptidase n=1 Tax=Abyssisolibacter fermentans TaxID=1766203 RepID=UPI00083576E7|nr:aminoacyl-histidine dipeptidase [Abyssisolibacter fermentans]